MANPTILTTIGTKVRLTTQYEFLEPGREGTVKEYGRSNPPDPQRTLIIDLGDGELELDMEHFSLFEVVLESEPPEEVHIVNQT